MKKIAYGILVAVVILVLLVMLPSRFEAQDLPIRSFSRLKVLLEFEYPLNDSICILSYDESQKLFRTMSTDLSSECANWNFGEKGHHITVRGWLYVFPSWQDNVLMRWLIPYLRHGIYMDYDPFNEKMFLSEDSRLFAWDHELGLCVSNVHPQVVGVDINLLKERFGRKGDGSDSWKYRGRQGQ